MIVLLSGSLTQIIYFYLIYIIYYYGLINQSTYNIFYNYHYSLLIFNLLPIHPLDGSKLINNILGLFISFKKAHLFMIYISIIGIFFIFISFIFIKLNINLYLLSILLIIKLIEEYKNHNSIFNRFLLERYLYNYYYKKIKIIKNKRLDLMNKNKKHLFIINDKVITEKEMLRKRYRS